MEKEEWRMIPGFEGLYMVSNLGRVKNVKRNRLKTASKCNGYMRVCLSKNGNNYYYYVHVLVAMVFIDNPDNLSCVNHKDEDKTNNCVDNLEWCTIGYNNNYGSRNDKVSLKMTNGKLSKKVYQYTLEGKLVMVWESLREIGRQLGYRISSINACCLGKKHYNTAYGFIWRYESL